jgi:SulP family sulfate permease
LRAYDRAWLRGGLVAGLTAAAVVVPQAIAYADIAGLPLVYAVMGTSRPLSVTTTSMIAILTAGALQELVPGAKADLLVSAAL